MKKLLAFVLSASLSMSLFAANIFAYTPIKESVKMYTQTEYSVASKFGDYYRTPLIKVVHVFDGNGFETESTELSPRDAVLDKISNKYDSRGNLIEQVCTDVDGNIIWKNVSTFKNGKKENTAEYDAKGALKAKIIYTYDGDKIAEENGYNGDGAIAWKTIYKYNADGLCEKVIQYTGAGTLDSEELYTYTETGDIETITAFDGFAEKATQKVFRYTNNVLTEITTYNEKNEVTNRVIYKNDAKGNPIKISEYNIANKFGTTVNELLAIVEITYQY